MSVVRPAMMSRGFDMVNQGVSPARTPASPTQRPAATPSFVPPIIGNPINLQGPYGAATKFEQTDGNEARRAWLGDLNSGRAAGSFQGLQGVGSEAAGFWRMGNAERLKLAGLDGRGDDSQDEQKAGDSQENAEDAIVGEIFSFLGDEANMRGFDEDWRET